MISLEEAVAAVLEPLQPLDGHVVGLGQAHGSVLSSDVVATVDTPPFDASAMDGYAVRSDDLLEPVPTLRVVGTSSCGHPASVRVTPGTAVRILTGAVVPDGADCVVRIEATDGGDDVVTVHEPVVAGADVRRHGEVGRRGDVLVASGTVLHAGHLGTIAGTGVTHVEVRRRPVVAVVATGDELVPPDRGRLGPGQIYDSNGTLMSQLAERAGCEVRIASAGDDPAALRSLLEELSRTADVVLTSGGVSMGAEFDPLRDALSSHPVEFWQVAIRPAKPLAYGRIDRAAYVGLPGNPVAVVVSFELFVRPLLRALSGIAPRRRPFDHGVAGETIERPKDGATHLVPVRCDRSGSAPTWVPTRLLGSHALADLDDAEALAVLSPDDRYVPAGGALRLLPLWS